MDFIFDNFQILIVVAGIIIAGLNKLREMKGANCEEPDWKPIGRPNDDDDDFEPARPISSLPKRMVPPPLPSYGNSGTTSIPAEEFQPSSLTELERQRKLQERLRSVREAKATSTAATKTAKKQQQPAKKELVSPTRLRSRLRDPKELRRAIVMREILGPPVSLK